MKELCSTAAFEPSASRITSAVIADTYKMKNTKDSAE